LSSRPDDDKHPFLHGIGADKWRQNIMKPRPKGLAAAHAPSYKQRE
jgi:hypothetical protein